MKLKDLSERTKVLSGVGCAIILLVAVIVIMLIVIRINDKKHLEISESEANFSISIPLSWNHEEAQANDFSSDGYFVMGNDRQFFYEMGTEVVGRFDAMRLSSDSYTVDSDTTPNGYSRKISYPKYGNGSIIMYIEKSASGGFGSPIGLIFSGYADTYEEVNLMLDIFRSVDFIYEQN